MNFINRKFLITENGLTKIKNKLESLRAERAFLIEELKAALAQGDLSENAEYTSVNQRLSNMKPILEDLALLLENYTLISSPPDTSIVRFGAEVSILDTASNMSETFVIGNYVEAMISRNVISFDNPFAKAMIGKKLNDTFIYMPNEQNYTSIGYDNQIKTQYKILDVKYA